jgi:hypothetical protein
LAVCFCGTFPKVALAGRYPAPYFRGARTFLSPLEAESGHPAVWQSKIGRARGGKSTPWDLAAQLMWVTAAEPIFISLDVD